MSSPEFQATIERLQPALKAWGEFVVGRVKDLVKLEVGADRFSRFFKIEPGFRTKDVPSAVRKLEKKRYENPEEQMTDLVGARFVVLLRTDIEVVERVITSHTAWTKSKDRDPDGERDEQPTHFDYQSVHYVLRNNREEMIGGVLVPEGLPCEVQIRTLLQHAYAELVHDRFYKAVNVTPPSARRLVARSMALMETTDDLFCTAVRELDQVNQEREQWCNLVDDEIGPILPGYVRSDEDADALEIIDTYKHLLDSARREDVRAQKVPQVIEKIQAKAPHGGLFAKPVVLLVYWLVKEHGMQTEAHWPNAALRDDLNQVMAHLGIGSTTW